MSETTFPVNDLLRRKLSTGLTILSLTTCVASTLFLLIFSGQVGFGIAAVAQDTLSGGISVVLSQFLTFSGALIFVVGAVIVSFIVFLMMAQRTRDYGLMKATGCPNGLVFGYFFTELLGVTFIGCVLGTVLGLGTDYAVIGMFPSYNKAPNFWFVPIVFATFFAFALIFGAKPIFDAARMLPVKAISSVQYFGLSKGTAHKPLQKSGLTIRIATRSLFRRKSATVRIVIFLSAVFLLLTVSIAGGIVANDTTASWVQKTAGKDTIMIANKEMAAQYTELLLRFSGKGQENPHFNYSNPAFGLSDSLIQQISQVPGVTNVDTRLVWRNNVQEISGFKTDPDTLATMTMGDSRQCESIIVGVDPAKATHEIVTEGRFLDSTSSLQAVVGDSLTQAIYSPFTVLRSYGQQTIQSDPLLEQIRIQGLNFKIVGMVVDALNNGNTTYIQLDKLMNLTGLKSQNVALITVGSTADYMTTLNAIQIKMQGIDANLAVVDLNQVSIKNVDFLSSLWAVIMFLPAFALAAATLCLISYLMLAIDEQRQEFGILRATGAKPRTIMSILAVQSLVVLLASFGIGTSFGMITCILILTSKPVVSVFTVLSISGWLLAALSGIFLLSIYPAIKFASKPLIEIMS